MYIYRGFDKSQMTGHPQNYKKIRKGHLPPTFFFKKNFFLTINQLFRHYRG